MTTRESDLVRRQRVEFHHAMASRADRWVAACGGQELPFVTRSGRILLYVFNPAAGRHAYLDTATDVVLSDEAAEAFLQRS